MGSSCYAFTFKSDMNTGSLVMVGSYTMSASCLSLYVFEEEREEGAHERCSKIWVGITAKHYKQPVKNDSWSLTMRSSSEVASTVHQHESYGSPDPVARSPVDM